MIVSTPAAARTPQSIPEAETVRVMVAAIGFAAVVVRVLASSSSTHENMKQKKAATPMPLRDQRHEDLHEKARERVSVDIGGLVDFLRNAGHEAFQNPHRQRHVEQAVGDCDCDMRVDQTEGGIKLEERQSEDGGGAMRLVSSQKNRCLSPRNR